MDWWLENDFISMDCIDQGGLAWVFLCFGPIVMVSTSDSALGGIGTVLVLVEHQVFGTPSVDSTEFES